MNILLLVEDFSYFLKFKEQTSFNVFFAYTESEAHSLLKNSQFNLIFCDPSVISNWNNLLSFNVPVIAHSNLDELNLWAYKNGALTTLKKDLNPNTQTHNFIANCLTLSGQ